MSAQSGISFSDSLSDPLDQVWDLLTPFFPQCECSIAVYEGHQLVLSKGGLGASDELSLPENHNELTSQSFANDEVWAACTTTRTQDDRLISLVVSVPFVFQAQLSELQLQAYSRIGLLLVKQSLEINTLYKNLEQSIKEREAVSGFIENGLLVLDRSGFLTYINEPGMNILDIKERDKPFCELLGFEPIISDVFYRREGYVDREVTVSINGSETKLFDTAIPIVGEEGDIVSIVNIFRRHLKRPATPARIVRDFPDARVVDLLGRSTVSQKIRQQLLEASRSQANLLISGEPGTGKVKISKIIHAESANRAEPHFHVMCATFSMSEFEHFILEHLLGCSLNLSGTCLEHDLPVDVTGTVFFESIDALPVPAQRKLLAALMKHRRPLGEREAGGTRFRFVASTTSDLPTILREQRLYQGLHGFFSECSIALPPLLKRANDIDLIARHLFSRAHPDKKASQYFFRFITSQPWPGNISQLKGVIDRLSGTDMSRWEDEVMMEVLNAQGRSTGEFTPFAHHEFSELGSFDAERQAVFLALQSMNFNLTRTAEVLGMSRPTLYSKMKKYNIASRRQSSKDIPLMK